MRLLLSATALLVKEDTAKRIDTINVFIIVFFKVILLFSFDATKIRGWHEEECYRNVIITLTRYFVTFVAKIKAI